MMKGKRITKPRDAPKEPLLQASEKARTPDWILRRYPNVPKEMPRQIVEEFNEYLAKANKLMDRYEKNLLNPEKLNEKADLYRARQYAERAKEENRDAREVMEEAYIFTDFMNNFSYMVFGRVGMYSEEDMKEKFGNTRNAGGYEASDLLKSQTRQEFYDTVMKVIQECGLSYEEGKELFKKPGNFANRYLFPAFLKLIEMGYKRYPDLVA